MTWRIEHTDSLALLSELPEGWVQTCIAYPPCGGTDDRVLSVVREVRRVLRDDGALWLFLPNMTQLHELRDAGWIEQRPPTWGRSLALRSAGARPLALLTKGRSFFHHSNSLVPPTRRGATTRRSCGHVQRCVRERDAIGGLAGRCVLTTTAGIACGTCGAPYMRGEPGERRPACVHRNAAGRCLVLDPFYRPGYGTLEAAHFNGRHFLGITDWGAGE